MTLYKHAPHPHVERRTAQGPVTLAQTRVSVNDRVAARATIVFGTMWCTYVFVIYGALGAVFTTEQATLLYWSNWIQLWSLPLLMVGAVVLGRAAERRNIQAFADTEAILHGQHEAAIHLAVQDAVIAAVAERLAVDVDQVAAKARAEIAKAQSADTTNPPES